MGKVLDLANKEYDILQEVRQAIDGIDREERFEKRYLDELKEDLQKIISLHYQKNDLKRKYYRLRQSNRELATGRN